VADFTAGYDASVWPPIWEDFYCDWRELWFNQRIEPPSWIVGDMVIAAGGKGILFPSQARAGGTNLVLFVNALTATDSLQVYDPGRSLPQNQDSWQGNRQPSLCTLEDACPTPRGAARPNPSAAGCLGGSVTTERVNADLGQKLHGHAFTLTE
jgi:hypothetical protein